MSNPSQNKLEQITKMQNLLQNGIEQITKMQNLLRNGLEQIAKTQNLWQNYIEQIAEKLKLLRNELEQIAKIRHIKNYKNISKEELLLALLKSECSLAKSYKSNFSNVEIEKIRKKFNALKGGFSRSKIRKIKEKICKITENNFFFLFILKKKKNRLIPVLLNYKKVFTNLKSIMIMIILITKE